MGRSRWIVGALFALAATGCCSNRGANNQQLLERELRFQETELWRLRDEIDSLGCQMESVQRENDTLKREQLGVGSGFNPIPSRSGASPALSEPAIELTPLGPPTSSRRSGRAESRSSDAPREIDAPNIELGPNQPADGSMSPGGSNSDSLNRSAPGELPPGSMQTLGDAPARGASPEERTRAARRADLARLAAHATPLSPDARAAQIVIVRHLTGGRDRDGRPGHEGITIGFEPRDENGQFVPAKGDVSIVVLDPASNGPEARVARWDFKASEAAAHFGGKGLSRGYYFDLPWSGQPPVNEKLQVFVRLVTPDGARLVTDQNIDVSLPPSKPNQTWTAARPRSATSALRPASDPAASPRPRFFTRVKTGSHPGAGPLPADGSPQLAAPDEELVEVYIDPQTGVASLAPNAGAGGSRLGPSTRLIDRTRMRGGPGLIAFDGSMIRSWTGGGSAATKNSAPQLYRIDPNGAAVDGQYAVDSPYGQGPGNNGPMLLRPPMWSDSGSAAGGPSLGESPGGDWVTTQEPIGGPPAQDDSPTIEDPPTPHVARPTWRPYR